LKTRWDTALPITTIQKQHVFRRASATELFISRFATDEAKRVQIIATRGDQADGEEIACLIVQPSLVIQATVGDWVLVQYEGSMFPGEVKEIGRDELKVSVMVPSGANYFKWPASEDSIFYHIKNVMMKLKPPTIKSARGTYEFSEKW